MISSHTLNGHLRMTNQRGTTEYQIKPCKKCGNEDIRLEESGEKVRLYCNQCGNTTEQSMYLTNVVEQWQWDNRVES